MKIQNIIKKILKEIQLQSRSRPMAKNVPMGRHPREETQIMGSEEAPMAPMRDVPWNVDARRREMDVPKSREIKDSDWPREQEDGENYEDFENDEEMNYNWDEPPNESRELGTNEFERDENDWWTGAYDELDAHKKKRGSFSEPPIDQKFSSAFRRRWKLK